jgi:hypothetical protein
LEIVNDELKVFRGKSFKVSEHIHISPPTLDEIYEYGESNYWNFVYGFTSTPQNFKVQLWDAGIDYTTITPYTLFATRTSRMYSVEESSILFGELDFTKFEPRRKSDDGSLIMSQQIGEDVVEMDEYTYNMVVDYLCQLHSITRDLKRPANNSTKMVLIEDAREEMLKSKDSQPHSQLKNLISAMVNSEGFKYDYDSVWNMKINAFMDSVKRICKIKNADYLTQSGYSGFGISFKDIDKKQLDWTGEL